jgi:EAL domain-containing protein (putative c-di-GMP-specific phosphodiesterase class I)
MTGMEALIRWKDEEMGLVSPKDFIPLAEETGMIIEIGNWAIHSACRQGKIWHDKGFGNLNLAVNLSVRQFFDAHLVDKIKSAIAATRFDPSYLELEITENRDDARYR